MKKLYRITEKFLLYLFLKSAKIIFWKSNYKIIPAIAEYDKLKFDYSKKTRRLVLRKQPNTFDKIFFDSTHSETDLCFLGKKHSTNKSSLNLNGHRSGYTGLYSFLFNHLKKKKCSIAEIGIEKNGSTNMWREYFTKASIN